MSDEHERPLSRRELREREGWVAASPDEGNHSVSSEEFNQALATESVPVTTTSSIPVIGPDGRILTRRELRELWAAEEAAAQANAVVEAPAETSDVQDASDVSELPQSEDAGEAHVPGEATESADEAVAHDAADAADTATELPAATEVPTETEDIPDASSQREGRRFPWRKSKSSDEGESQPEDLTGIGTGVVAAAATAGVATRINSTPESSFPESSAVEGVSVDEADAEYESEITAEEAADIDTAPIVDETPEVREYSFPEVSPDPESRSIFDQQTTATIGFVPTTEISDSSDTGAFDDIITRAVADEGAASPTNTAALILPTLPDTTDLSGALNETGEIVITGSIELPRTLGETGGHIALHDTLDPHEAAVLGHEAHEVVLEAESQTQPVSAMRAVSAQSSNNALVGPPSKNDSKLPLILAISAGGLIVVVAGVFIWAASTGLFG